MKIATPLITNFNKDRLAPANEKLASFIVGQLPKNIMKPFMFISTSKLNITYQKLRDRYEYLRRLEPMTPCDPKCQEGWYWDCETETCKEYSSYHYYRAGSGIENIVIQRFEINNYNQRVFFEETSLSFDLYDRDDLCCGMNAIIHKSSLLQDYHSDNMTIIVSGMTFIEYDHPTNLPDCFGDYAYDTSCESLVNYAESLPGRGGLHAVKSINRIINGYIVGVK